MLFKVILQIIELYDTTVENRKGDGHLFHGGIFLMTVPGATRGYRIGLMGHNSKSPNVLLVRC